MPPLIDAPPAAPAPLAAAYGLPQPVTAAVTAPQHFRLAQEELLAGRVGSATRRFADLVDRPETTAVRAGALAGLVECRLARGDLDAAAATVARLTRSLVTGETPGTLARAFTAYATGDLAGARGEPEEASEHYLHAGLLLGCLDLDSDPGSDLEGGLEGGLETTLLPWRISAALALTARGRRQEAVQLTEAHAALAQRSGSAYAAAQALRVSSVTDLGPRREPLLREARAVLAPLKARRLAAQIDTDLACLLLLRVGDARSPERTEALALLLEVERYAVAEELWPLRSRVARLFERAGAGTSGLAWERFDQLTSAERRVVVLAVDGLTNRQIADHLAVSVKAVEWHLSRVYRKLAIRSRRELAGTLGVSARSA